MKTIVFIYFVVEQGFYLFTNPIEKLGYVQIATAEAVKTEQPKTIKLTNFDYNIPSIDTTRVHYVNGIGHCKLTNVNYIIR